MKYRHRNHDAFTLAAIDSLIERGDVQDWLRLAREVRVAPAVRERVGALCNARLGRADPEFYSVEEFRYWRRFLDSPQSDEDVIAGHDRCSLREISTDEFWHMKHEQQAIDRKLIASGELSPEDVLLIKPDQVRGAKITWPEDDCVIELVFLGIDGVLQRGPREKSNTLDFSSCIPLLESVLREFPDVQIVITGSWCHRHSMADLRAIFSPDIGSRVIGAVPGSGRRHRQRRINAYLALHDLKGVAWMVLDRWSEPVGDYYIHCIDGFQEGEACVLRKYLAGGRRDA